MTLKIFSKSIISVLISARFPTANSYKYNLPKPECQWDFLGFDHPHYEGQPELYLPSDDVKAVRYLTSLNKVDFNYQDLSFKTPKDAPGVFFTALREDDFVAQEILPGVPTFISDGDWGVGKIVGYSSYSSVGGGWWVAPDADFISQLASSKRGEEDLILTTVY